MKKQIMLLLTCLSIGACADDPIAPDPFVGTWVHVTGKGSYSLYDCQDAEMNQTGEPSFTPYVISKFDDGTYWSTRDTSGLEFEFRNIDGRLLSTGQQETLIYFYGSLQEFVQKDASFYFDGDGNLNFSSRGEVTFNIGHQEKFRNICSYTLHDVAEPYNSWIGEQ